MPAMSIVRKVALFGRPSRRPGDRVDLLDRVLARFDRAEDLRHAERPMWLAMKSGRVLRDDDALAQPHGRRRRAMRRDDRGIGVGCRDQLEQVQVARRIEEVRAEPVPAEAVAAALGERRDRDARRVRADDRLGAAHRLDALEQRSLDVEPLDDGFDDPVGRRRARPGRRRSRRS